MFFLLLLLTNQDWKDLPKELTSVVFDVFCCLAASWELVNGRMQQPELRTQRSSAEKHKAAKQALCFCLSEEEEGLNVVLFLLFLPFSYAQVHHFEQSVQSTAVTNVSRCESGTTNSSLAFWGLFKLFSSFDPVHPFLLVFAKREVAALGLSQIAFLLWDAAWRMTCQLKFTGADTYCNVHLYSHPYLWLVRKKNPLDAGEAGRLSLCI